MPVELTHEQTDQWIAIAKVCIAGSKWSIEGVDVAAKEAEMSAAR